jgi:hypothetical protein
VRSGAVEFKDINEQPDALPRFGASLDEIRRRLHATDEAGRFAWRYRSRGLSMTRLPICCLPGINGAGAGERLSGASRL